MNPSGRRIHLAPVAGLEGAPGPFGPHSEEVRRFLEHASCLTRGEILRLDLTQRRDPELLLVGWDHVRDRLRDAQRRVWLRAARRAGWEVIRRAGAACEIDIGPDDAYWRVEPGVGYGAARVVRAMVGALIAPELLDPEYVEIIRAPWRAAVEDTVDPDPPAGLA